MFSSSLSRAFHSLSPEVVVAVLLQFIRHTQQAGKMRGGTLPRVGFADRFEPKSGALQAEGDWKWAKFLFLLPANVAPNGGRAELISHKD